MSWDVYGVYMRTKASELDKLQRLHCAVSFWHRDDVHMTNELIKNNDATLSTAGNQGYINSMAARDEHFIWKSDVNGKKGSWVIKNQENVKLDVIKTLIDAPESLARSTSQSAPNTLNME